MVTENDEDDVDESDVQVEEVDAGCVRADAVVLLLEDVDVELLHEVDELDESIFFCY